MRTYRLTVLVFFYFCLDLTNPFVRSAFTFEAADSIEAVSVRHRRIQQHADAVPMPRPTSAEPGRTALHTPVKLSQARALAEWRVDLRQGHGQSSASDPQSPAEDH